MNEKIKNNKVVTWVKENKGKVIAGAVSIGLLGLMVYKIKNMQLVSEGGKPLGDDIVTSFHVPEALRNMGVDDIENYGKCYEFMTGYANSEGQYPIQVKDIANLADKVKTLPGVTDESDIWLMVSVGQNLGNM